jgi:hypothetical protein
MAGVTQGREIQVGASEEAIQQAGAVASPAGRPAAIGIPHAPGILREAPLVISRP